MQLSGQNFVDAVVLQKLEKLFLHFSLGPNTWNHSTTRHDIKCK